MGKDTEILQADWYGIEDIEIYDGLHEKTAEIIKKTTETTGEILDIYTEQITNDGKKIYVKKGQVEREEAHRIGALHAGAQIWVYNSKGQVLLQRRSFDPKKSSPGLLDTSAAGHIPIGETIISGGLLEVRQEIGLDATPEELTHIGYYRRETKSESRYNNEINTIFLLPFERELSDLKKQDSEVAELIFISIEKLEEDWNDPVVLAGYTSKGEQYRQKILLNLKKVLGRTD